VIGPVIACVSLEPASLNPWFNVSVPWLPRLPLISRRVGVPFDVPPVVITPVLEFVSVPELMSSLVYWVRFEFDNVIVPLFVNPLEIVIVWFAAKFALICDVVVVVSAPLSVVFVVAVIVPAFETGPAIVVPVSVSV